MYDNLKQMGEIIYSTQSHASQSTAAIVKSNTGCVELHPKIEDIQILMDSRCLSLQEYTAEYCISNDTMYEKERIWPVEPDVIE